MRAEAAKLRDAPLTSRAISHARGHLRVSRFAGRTTEMNLSWVMKPFLWGVTWYAVLLLH